MKKHLLFIFLSVAVLVTFGIVYYLSTVKPKIDDVVLETKKTKEAVLPKKEEEKLSFIIGGDVMLGRAVAWKFKNDVTQAFENLGEGFFAKEDMGILNLEGPISATEFQADPTPDNLIFNFPPQSVDALKYLGVSAVSLANNHSYNQGKTGFEETKTLLNNAGIVSIGNQKEFGMVRLGDVKKKLSLITINLLEDNSDITGVITDEKKAGNVVLVFPHWGSEYENQSHGQLQENAAHSWIEAGADIVIGSHPHVVQDIEIYKNKPIVYSLGNLIFDQTFSVPTQEGLIVKGNIVDNKLTLEFLPTKIINYQVELKDGEVKDQTIENLLKNIPAEYIKNSKIELSF